MGKRYAVFCSISALAQRAASMSAFLISTQKDPYSLLACSPKAPRKVDSTIEVASELGNYLGVPITAGPAETL